MCDGCSFHGRDCGEGERFPDPQDACRQCTCSGGTVTCLPTPCPPAACKNPVALPDQCCPKCMGVCHSQGRLYQSGETFTSLQDACQTCTCLAEVVTCQPKSCPQQCSHPVSPIAPACCPTCDSCLYEGQKHANRQTFVPPSEPCQRCSCLHGNVACTPLICPPAPCASPLHRPGHCCPQCPVCQHAGQEYPEGAQWISALDPCQQCSCVNGEPSCEPVPCKDPLCSHPALGPGQCCPLCHDCLFEGELYTNGQAFNPESCLQCSCQDGNVRCDMIQCPATSCSHPVTEPGVCCPRCKGCVYEGRERPDGSRWLSSSVPCMACMCVDGVATCAEIVCISSCINQIKVPGECCPLCAECLIEVDGRRASDGETWRDSVDDCVTCSCSLGHIECHIQECVPVVCPEGQAKVQTPGRCCAQCQDPGGSCSHHGRTFQPNEQWQVDECTTCSCISGEVHCNSKRCPPVVCAADETPAWFPGMCCPHCVPRPATCVAFGDPHYRTFDGKMVHFQGTCTYVMAQDCDGGDFSIHVTNDDHERTGVSWTKEVMVLIGNVAVQLLQDRVVMVDSQTVTLPFLKEPHLYVELKANTLLLNTNIGVKVLWNGRSHLEVSVPGTYKGRTCGLCGNFNSYPQDDLRLRSGHLTLSEAAFGNSWKVVRANATQQGRCADGLDVDPCKESGYRSLKEANTRCKVLKSPPFERCHAVVPPEPFFASCVYDLCACGIAGSDECLCEALEAYAAQCRHAGLVLHWRSPTLCAVGCPQDRGYVFDECGPPCPKTCFNHAVPLGVLESHCFKPCVPGCQCPAGLVEHEAHCILPEACPRVIYGTL
uniref:Uncharacterized protein n=1 Tax=Sphaerodactylus townsendi TaxID=933632 RepID=A0ACB8FLC1_9SAUR